MTKNNGVELHELDANAILTADDLAIEKVETPEWGGFVHVRGMTGDERDAWEASLLDANGKPQMIGIRASMAARCMVSASGERIFKDSHAKKLGEKSSAALNRVFEVARRLSGLTDDDVEELEKNSDAAMSGDSGSN